MSERDNSNILFGAAGLVAILLVLSFVGGVYFNSHPDAMNQPLIPANYHLAFQVVVGIIGLVLLASLVYSKKEYFAARVIACALSLGLLFFSWLWWDKILPYLYV